MLLTMAVRSDPSNLAALRKLRQAARGPAQPHPTLAQPPPRPAPPPPPSGGPHVSRETPRQARPRARWQVRDLRLRKQPSVPSTMAEECSFNPWMKATPLDLARLCGCEM